jgi:hypothetical protein
MNIAVDADPNNDFESEEPTKPEGVYYAIGAQADAQRQRNALDPEVVLVSRSAVTRDMRRPATGDRSWEKSTQPISVMSMEVALAAYRAQYGGGQ